MSFLLNPFLGVTLPVAGPHRYWRVKIPSVQTGTVIAALAELQLFESYFGPNVATGGTASADSIFDSNYPASEAFDGNLMDTADGTSRTSVWASVSGGALPHWIAYDFGAGVTKEIKAIGIHGRVAAGIPNMATALALEYSDDGSVWAEAWNKSGLSWSEFEYKHLTNLSPPAYSGSPHGAHSYWRIFINQGEGVPYTSVTELEFRATPGGADQANGGTAAASSTYSGSFPASAAFDNNTTTYWHNGADLEFGWLRYQFPSPVSVAQIAITARASSSPIGGPINFAVQYADSASGPWTTAWNVIGQPAWTNGETRTFTDPNYA